MSDPLDFACRAVGCKKPVKASCIYTSGAKKGKPCGPHPLRVALADGAASRDGEVAGLADQIFGLTGQVTSINQKYLAMSKLYSESDSTRTTLIAERDALKAQVGRLVPAYDSMADHAATLEGDLEDLTAANTSAQMIITKQSVAYATLTKERDALQARLDALEPEPTRTLFGACPNPKSSATSLAGQRAPFLKYGSHPLTVRQFLSTQVAPRAPQSEVIRVHISWNLGTMKLADVTGAWVTKVCANLLPGDEVEVIHEADKKVTDGKRTFTDAVNLKNAFFDAVVTARPDLVVVHTVTGWLFDPKSKKDWKRWGVVKAHRIGVDCDGVHDDVGPTIDTDYAAEMETAKQFCELFGDDVLYTGIVVPEFGDKRPVFDFSGNVRAAWDTEQAGIFTAAGVLEVNQYDFAVGAIDDEFYPGTPEFAVWQALVAGNVA